MAVYCFCGRWNGALDWSSEWRVRSVTRRVALRRPRPKRLKTPSATPLYASHRASATISHRYPGEKLPDKLPNHPKTKNLALRARCGLAPCRLGNHFPIRSRSLLMVFGPWGLVATLLDPKGRRACLPPRDRVCLCSHRSSPPRPTLIPEGAGVSVTLAARVGRGKPFDECLGHGGASKRSRTPLPFSVLGTVIVPGEHDGKSARVPDSAGRRSSHPPSRRGRRSGVWHGGGSGRRAAYCAAHHRRRGSASVRGALHRDRVGTGTWGSIRIADTCLGTASAVL